MLKFIAGGLLVGVLIYIIDSVSTYINLSLEMYISGLVALLVLPIIMPFIE